MCAYLESNNQKKDKVVSFKGIAKTKLTQEELDISIEKAKKSLFKTW